MDRRNFLQATGLSTVAVLVSRPTGAAPVVESKKPNVKKLPARSEVRKADTWDLSSFFADDAAWDKTFEAWQKKIESYASFRGKLAESAQKLADCIRFDLDVQRAGDRLGTYAHLKTTEDQGNSDYQRMLGRFMQAASRVGQASSFLRPEILAIPEDKMDEFLQSPALAPYKILLERILRFKPHTLGDKEEKLLAMQAEMAAGPTQIFRQLNDTDMKFGTVQDEKGRTIELSHGTLSTLLNSPSREVRATAFNTFYQEYTDHAHTLAATLSAVVQKDIYYARARNFASAREAALFPDNVPVTVYDNLIASVHRQFPALYHYFDVRRRKMGLPDIHFYDTYVPILAELQTRHTWDQAVKKIVTALEPLGSEYCGILERGLSGRWCDRYENRGKQSGAFSSGCFDSDPVILMNYQPNVLEHVFILAHEGGHSMHSYFSKKNQPFAYHQYTLFVAEVASTFNETLLNKYLLAHAADDQERAFLLNRRIDSMRQTIFRQTMFAEFEKLAHASAEAGEPLTLDRIKELYHGLLAQYFGPDFTLDPGLDLEGLRIPHFYRNFYVYKYATGLSAAMALVERVTQGGKQELADYLNFLKGGGSKFPLDLLRDAGVDMEQPQGVDNALAQFGPMVKELDSLI
ncbi:MAG: oligoendopeptidase F [Pirellulales bacterium]|nr:oligoendopeptidase F [Pirellulales bacterium]